jgi:hypothetical protein
VGLAEVGTIVGSFVGIDEGCVGVWVGPALGLKEGTLVGPELGLAVGLALGGIVG